MTDVLTMETMEQDERVRKAAEKLRESEARLANTTARLEALHAELKRAEAEVDEIFYQREIAGAADDGTAATKAQAKVTRTVEAIAQGKHELDAIGRAIATRRAQVETVRKVVRDETGAQLAMDYEETMRRLMKALEPVGPLYDRGRALVQTLERLGLRITISRLPQIAFQYIGRNGAAYGEQLGQEGVAILRGLKLGVTFKPPTITVLESKVCAAELEPTPAPEPVARATAATAAAARI